MKAEETARELHSLVHTILPRLSSISEEESLARPGPGTWARKEILGHLIDSAVNNLHRFIRGQQADELRFPDYDQPFWVDRSGYAGRPWFSLVQLWGNVNIHLAHVLERIPESRLETPCHIGRSEPQTLGFIASDYLTHLNHHIDQLLG